MRPSESTCRRHYTYEHADGTRNGMNRHAECCCSPVGRAAHPVACGAGWGGLLALVPEGTKIQKGDEVKKSSPAAPTTTHVPLVPSAVPLPIAHPQGQPRLGCDCVLSGGDEGSRAAPERIEGARDG